MRPVARAEQLANLALAVAGHLHEAPGHLDRLLFRLHLDDRVTNDQLLRLGEWPVGHGELASSESNASALRTGEDPAGVEQDSSFRRVLAELGERGHLLGG